MRARNGAGGSQGGLAPPPPRAAARRAAVKGGVKSPAQESNRMPGSCYPDNPTRLPGPCAPVFFGSRVAGRNRPQSGLLHSNLSGRGVQKKATRWVALCDFGAPGEIDSAHPGPRPAGVLRTSKSAPGGFVELAAQSPHQTRTRKTKRPLGGAFVFLARPERFELPTFWFVARHSIQLSYGRTFLL